MEGQQGKCPVTGAARAYGRFAGMLNWLQPVFLLVVRAYIGYQAAISGWAHLHNVDDTASFFQSLHIPHPRLNVYIAGGTELVGGILIALGLFSRLVAIPFSFNFLIAILSVDLADPTKKQKLLDLWNDQNILLNDTAFPFLFVGLIVLIFGPGLFSLDALLKRLFCRKPADVLPDPVQR